MIQFTRILSSIICLCFSVQLLSAQHYLIDSSFGIQGIARIQSNDTTNEMPFNGWAKGFGLQQNENIISIHTPYINSIIYGPVVSHGLIRFTSDGKKIDSSFGVNGVKNRIFDPLSIVSANYNAAYASAILDDGRILAGGQKKLHNPPFTYLVSVVCFDSTGRVDSSYGNQGVFLYNNFAGSSSTSGSYSRVLKILPQSETRILLHCMSDGSEGNFLLAITSNGQIDSSYGINGIQDFNAFDQINEREFYHSVVLLSNGSAFIHATSYDSTLWTHVNNYLIKLKPNGTIDSGFGILGKQIINTNIPVYHTINHLYLNSLELQGNSTLISLMDSKNGDYQVVVRFNQDGRIDSTFGVNGLCELPFVGSIGIHNLFNPEACKVLKNNYIVVTGRAIDSNQTSHTMDVLVVLIKADGKIDSSFGSQGIRIIDGGSGINDGGTEIISNNANSFIVCGSDYEKYYEMIKFSTASFPNEIPSVTQKNVSIYPNPANDFIIINSGDEVNEVVFYDMMGRICQRSQVDTHTNKIDVSSLHAGIYLLSISTSEQAISSRLVQIE